jgi:DNA-binding LacI/PurR family transcriptional regulator
VGFDDSVLAQTSRPELTTVRQDIVKLGETVANLMINVINGEKPQPIILPTELVVRESA